MISKIGRNGLMLAVSTVACLWAGSAALAQDGGASPVKSAPAREPSNEGMAATPKRTLLNSIFTFSNSGPALTGGFQQIDGVRTIGCPATSVSCTIQVEQHVQLQGNASNNRFAICTKVDGVFMNQPLCPFIGLVGTTFYTSGSGMQIKSGIAPGNHTVQTFVYTDAAATKAISSITYRIYDR